MLEKFHIPDRSMLVDIQYVRENRKDKIISDINGGIDKANDTANKKKIVKTLITIPIIYTTSNFNI